MEKEYLGGTCLNVGCIPSKALIAAGALLDRIAHAGTMGITAEGVRVDVAKLVEWKAGIVARLTGGIGTLLGKHGVGVVMGTASLVDRNSVRVASAEGEQTIASDQIASTVGRRPYSEGLGLERVGLQVDAKGFLEVDRRMRTKVDNIYAIGDIAGQPMLAHKGSKEGLVAAAVIAGQAEEYDARCVPAVIFTAPEMASVGKLERELDEEGRAYKVGSFPFAASGRALSLMETDGFVKVVADAETDEVLGVHMVGPEVTELIAEATLAIEMGATAEDLARTIHAHPTLPEALMEAAEAVHGMAVHIFQKR